MRIKDILNEAKQKPAELEPVASDELDKQDDQENQIDEPEDTDTVPPGVDELAKHASNLGADLYTITALDYESGFDIGRGEASIISLLNKIAKKLPQLAPAVKFMRGTDGADGAMAQIFVNGRNGYVFTMDISESGVNVSPDDWVSNLDVDQATIVNKIIRIAEKYAALLAKLDDARSYRRAESERENVLWALNYDEQKWPQSKEPEWKRLGYPSEQVYNDMQDDLAKIKQRAEERYKAKKAAEKAAIEKQPAGRDKR